MAEAPLIWVDLEMTGLELESCYILEIASVVTDGELEIIAKGPNLVIHHDDAVLDGMDQWNTDHHGASGLTEASRQSPVTLLDAQTQTIEFLNQHCKSLQSPLCGNSVDTDRRFLEKDMPEIGAFLHYRTIDVTSIKELVRRWHGDAAMPKKKEAHRALDDIIESIAELRHYREHYFK